VFAKEDQEPNGERTNRLGKFFFSQVELIASSGGIGSCRKNVGLNAMIIHMNNNRSILKGRLKSWFSGE